MRITGWLLLLAGLFLCITVAWAPIGFLLMGVGLVSLQVAERNRRRPKLTAAAVPENVEIYLETLKPPRAEAPVVHREIAPTPAPTRPAARRAPPDTSPYDKEAWRRLVESDPDISQLNEVLADFGQSYVDEFATSYLADPDKDRLGVITDGIIAKASGANRPKTAASPVDVKPPIVSRQEPEVADTSNEFNFDLLPAPAPTTPPAETEAALIAAIAALTAAPAEPAKAPVAVDLPEPDRRREAIPIAAADDDLTEMIKKFAPDSSFLRKS